MEPTLRSARIVPLRGNDEGLVCAPSFKILREPQMKKPEIQELAPTEYNQWDDLVAHSTMGTVFHTSTWVTTCAHALNQHPHIVGYFENDRLLGGCSLFAYRWNTLLRIATTTSGMSAYGGAIVRSVPQRGTRRKQRVRAQYYHVLEALCTHLANQFDLVSMISAPSFMDVRVFTWKQWENVVRYTYLLPLGGFETQLSRNMRRRITKGRKAKIHVEKSTDVDAFFKILTATFSHQQLPPPVSLPFLQEMVAMLHQTNMGEMWLAKTASNEVAAGEIFVYDEKCAYRWSAASDPVLRNTEAVPVLLSTILQDLRQHGFSTADLMAADMPQLAEFIGYFNPQLVPCYQVEKQSSLGKIARHVYRLRSA